jgi:O-antigen/teichoic acid export membrane protein
MRREGYQPSALPVDRAGPSEGQGLARRVTGGVFWVLLAFGAYRLLSVVTNLILARLLSPGDFGLVSFALVAVGAFTLLQDLGVSAAVVYRDRFDPRVGSTALTLTVATSAVLFGLTVLVAPLVAELGGDPRIGPVLVALGGGLVISAFGAVHSALLIKILAARRKFWADVIPYGLSGAAAIGLALSGFGAWSLVAGYLVRTAATTALLWALTPIRPKPGFDPAVAADLLRYGRHIVVAAVVGFVSMNSDYFLIGHFLGPVDLGVYTLAFMLATLVPRAVSETASKVSFPALSGLREDPDSLFDLFRASMLAVSAAVLPLSLGLWVLAPPLVPAVFGPKWEPMAQPLQLLGIFGALQCLTYNFPPIFKAMGRPDILWKFSLARLLVPVPFMVLALKLGYGITGVAAAHIAAEVCQLPAFSAVLSRLTGRSLAAVWGPAVPVLAAGIPVLFAALLGPLFIPPLGLAVKTVAGAAGFFGLLLAGYLGLLGLFNPDLWSLGRQAALTVLGGAIRGGSR